MLRCRAQGGEQEVDVQGGLLCGRSEGSVVAITRRAGYIKASTSLGRTSPSAVVGGPRIDHKRCLFQLVQTYYPC